MHNLPGFTAEASLTQAGRYRSNQVVQLSVEQGVVPQNYVVQNCSADYCVCVNDYYDDFGNYLYSQESVVC